MNRLFHKETNLMEKKIYIFVFDSLPQSMVSFSKQISVPDAMENAYNGNKIFRKYYS